MMSVFLVVCLLQINRYNQNTGAGFVISCHHVSELRLLTGKIQHSDPWSYKTKTGHQNRTDLLGILERRKKVLKGGGFWSGFLALYLDVRLDKSSLFLA